MQIRQLAALLPLWIVLPGHAAPPATTATGAANGPASVVTHASLLAYPAAKIADIDGGTTYYVEGDGRHVAALSRKGELIWRTEVLPASQTCSAGSPVVRHIQAKNDKILITFCKHSYGELDRTSGVYHFLGQD